MAENREDIVKKRKQALRVKSQRWYQTDGKYTDHVTPSHLSCEWIDKEKMDTTGVASGKRGRSTRTAEEVRQPVPPPPPPYIPVTEDRLTYQWIDRYSLTPEEWKEQVEQYIREYQQGAYGKDLPEDAVADGSREDEVDMIVKQYIWRTRRKQSRALYGSAVVGFMPALAACGIYVLMALKGGGKHLLNEIVQHMRDKYHWVHQLILQSVKVPATQEFYKKYGFVSQLPSDPDSIFMKYDLRSIESTGVSPSKRSLEEDQDEDEKTPKAQRVTTRPLTDSIPRDLLSMVIQNLDKKDWVSFLQTNQETYADDKVVRSYQLGKDEIKMSDYQRMPKRLQSSVKDIYYNVSEFSSEGTFPPSLTRLTFDWYYNKVIPVGILPSTLTHLALEGKYNQVIAPGVLPDSLIDLTFGYDYNQVLVPGVLPRCLVRLDFGNKYNQVVSIGVLPSFLTRLTFGESFDQLLAPRVLPESLTYLEFGQHYNQILSEGVLPESLTDLVLGYEYNQKIQPGVLPNSLRRIYPYREGKNRGFVPDSFLRLDESTGYAIHTKVLGSIGILPSDVRVYQMKWTMMEDEEAEQRELEQTSAGGGKKQKTSESSQRAPSWSGHATTNRTTPYVWERPYTRDDMKEKADQKEPYNIQPANTVPVATIVPFLKRLTRQHQPKVVTLDLINQDSIAPKFLPVKEEEESKSNIRSNGIPQYISLDHHSNLYENIDTMWFYSFNSMNLITHLMDIVQISYLCDHVYFPYDSVERFITRPRMHFVYTTDSYSRRIASTWRESTSYLSIDLPPTIKAWHGDSFIELTYVQFMSWSNMAIQGKLQSIKFYTFDDTDDTHKEYGYATYNVTRYVEVLKDKRVWIRHGLQSSSTVYLFGAPIPSEHPEYSYIYNLFQQRLQSPLHQSPALILDESEPERLQDEKQVEEDGEEWLRHDLYEITDADLEQGLNELANRKRPRGGGGGEDEGVDDLLGQPISSNNTESHISMLDLILQSESKQAWEEEDEKKRTE